MKEIRHPYILRLAATLISIILIVLALYYLKVVIVPLLFSIIFAVMIFPFCMRLEKWGFSKGLAALTTIFIATIILGIIGYILLSQVSIFTEQIPQISTKMNLLINELRDFAAHKLSMKKTEVAGRIQEQLTQLQSSSDFMPASLLKVISAVLINIFLIPLYVFFLIYYRHFFIEFFYKVFQDADKELIDDTIQKMELVIKGYIFRHFNNRHSQCRSPVFHRNWLSDHPGFSHCHFMHYSLSRHDRRFIAGRAGSFCYNRYKLAASYWLYRVMGHPYY